MKDFVMLLKFSFTKQKLSTLITLKPNTFMFHFFVSFEGSFVSCFKVTFSTVVENIIMYSVNMLLKLMETKFFATTFILTFKHLPFMNSFFMLSQCLLQ